MSTSSETAPDLLALIQWLREKGMNGCLAEVREIPGRGRGLTVTQHVQPGTPLFTIPDCALLNLRTLYPLYPSLYDGKTKLKHGLTGIQLLTLHLLVHPQPSADPHFGPYIDSLPRDFESHPLTWRFRSETDPAARDLWDGIPLNIQRAVDTINTRFTNDRRVVEAIVGQLRSQGHLPETRPRDTNHDREPKDIFLWAWLCVNTRSIYYEFSSSPRSTYNVTLCPLLDFANYPADDLENFGSSVPTFHAPAALAPGDEVFLNYGGHPDATLFAEYGFVTGADARAQVDVGPELEPRLASEPAKRELLEGHGYWGEWTLHLTPTPHPSYRTMTALRLLPVSFPPGADPTHLKGVRLWRDTLNGVLDCMPGLGEKAARHALEMLCESIAREAAEHLSQFNHSSADYARQLVRALWQERLRVATAVVDASRRGDEF